jgi:hypothetical protein
MSESNGWRHGRAVLGSGTASTVVAVSATDYHDPVSNAQRSFSSSSADDSASGSGAKTVTVVYYDALVAGPFTETVTLNGTTPVATVASNICYIERLYADGGTNAGVITLHEDASGTGSITSIGLNAYGTGVGDNQTLACRHYVADGMTCKISAINLNTTGPTTFTLRVRDPITGSGSTIWTATVASNGNSESEDEHGLLEVEGPARLVMFAVPDADNYVLSASMHFKDE